MADTAPLPVAPSEHTLHRFTLEEFYAVYESSLKDTGLNYELLDGGIYEMAADGPRSTEWNGEINRWLIENLSRDYVVIPDKTLRAGEYWGPKPDFHVFSAELKAANVHGPDVLLAIEIADSTLRFDTKIKRPGYEKCGVRELWIMDVENKTNLVHRLGLDGVYGEPRKVRFDEEVEALLIPGLKLRLSDLPRLRS
jgi:Uma2 family endonuclease